MLKECKECLRKVPAAKGTCDCGYVFRKKKDYGFKESPVVLTSDRLRTSRHSLEPFQVDRNRKRKESLPSGSVKDLDEKPKEKLNVIEKMYPKRERNKITKYEGFYNVRTRGKLGTSDGAKCEKGLEIDTASKKKMEEKEDNKDESGGEEKIKKLQEKRTPKQKKTRPNDLEKDSTENTTEKNCREDGEENEQNSSKKSVNNSPPQDRNQLDIKTDKKDKDEKSTAENKKETSLITPNNDKQTLDCTHTSLDGTHTLTTEQKDDTTRDHHSSNIIQSPSVVILRKFDGSFHTENIDARIEIEINNDAELHVNDTDSVKPIDIKFSYDKESRKMIVTREKKDCKPLPEEEEKSSTTPLPERGEKRKRGRPRKNPVVVKVKRPVGRPRKNSMDVDDMEMRASMVSFPHKEGDYVKRGPGRPIGSKNVSSRPRGRPPGSKDLKPRKSRLEGNERINLCYAQGEFTDEYLLQTPHPAQQHKQQQQRHVFLSPPQLLASAKRQHLRNELLENVERERLQRKLEKNKGIWIPEHKKELFSCILDDINQRIANQSFKYLLK